jgi:hypothetical protein
MSNSLLTLGSFSFTDLECPDRIILKARQRLAVHHMGSGASVTDSLGDDCETASFRGTFTGPNTAARIRAIEYMRLRAAPLRLTWALKSLTVIIQEFELEYTSSQWIPYRLLCYVVRSNSAGTNAEPDSVSGSSDTQVGDILSLLGGGGMLPTSIQTAALLSLAGLDYDIAPSDAVSQALELLGMIDDQLASTAIDLGDSALSIPMFIQGAGPPIGSVVAAAGQEAALVLARNRLMDITVRAGCVS